MSLSDNQKLLGEAAYTGYNNARGRVEGFGAAPFSQLPAELQAAWAACGEAVSKTFVEEKPVKKAPDTSAKPTAR